MKHCPVCNTKAVDLYTGLCRNPDCTWEFEFIGTVPTPEIQARYKEKLKRAKTAYSRLSGAGKQAETEIETAVQGDYFIDPCDGQKYKTVKIGKQIWMAENLNVDRFRNGDIITEAKTNREWLNIGKNEQPAWCYYDNDTANGEKYGRLYNWYAVNDPRGLAPKNWEVPSNRKWKAFDFFAPVTKEEFGFNKLGGFRSEEGKFELIESKTFWYSIDEVKKNASEAYAFFSDKYTYNKLKTPKTYGFSVRCLRNF